MFLLMILWAVSAVVMFADLSLSAAGASCYCCRLPPPLPKMVRARFLTTRLITLGECCLVVVVVVVVAAVVVVRAVAVAVAVAVVATMNSLWTLLLLIMLTVVMVPACLCLLLLHDAAGDDTSIN